MNVYLTYQIHVNTTMIEVIGDTYEFVHSQSRHYYYYYYSGRPMDQPMQAGLFERRRRSMITENVCANFHLDRTKMSWKLKHSVGGGGTCDEKLQK